MADVEIAQGDFGVPSALAVGLRNANGERYIPDLASTITITLTRRGDGHQITGPCALTSSYSAEGDEVTWTPAEGDTDEPGLYDAQWTITNPDEEPLTLPTCSGAKSRIAFTVEICTKA
jgi:hypothetical protein